MLELKNLSKNYGRVQALKNVNITLSSGIYALLGPNGSGKSTMMNIIAGILPQSCGEVLYDGINVKALGAAYREKIGYMPQYPGMYPSFSVRDFLLYMSELKGLPRGNEGEVDSILRRVELDDCADRKISALSGGMKQRLSLAQAVLGSPQIIILDEPTAGLDPKQRIAVRNFIAEISADKTVLWATHIVSDIEGIAREVVILKKGEVIDIAAPEVLIEKMKDKVWSVHADGRTWQELKNKYLICGTVPDDDGLTLRLLSDASPCDDAINVVPTLEDYYLYIYGDIL
ncbi:MAG TPA: ATP-binding cassette domain-containing protein [Bacillota bacterium]|nr:ATP-binding cassette domain-containing protein [Bacillota bacterium]